MAIKSFDIDWNGTPEIIEYEDDITYGELESILQNSIDLGDVSKPKVDIPKYRFQILLKVLRKAPFIVNDAVALRNIKSRQANTIMKEVMKDYPLVKFLGDWVETFTGSLNPSEIDSLSTTSVP
jgi:hypothetical protein|tara:strand:- start:568 stop:939 length:372 start_codon:yes stop_codon:yes gene_type:complete